MRDGVYCGPCYDVSKSQPHYKYTHNIHYKNIAIMHIQQHKISYMVKTNVRNKKMMTQMVTHICSTYQHG